MAGESYSLHVGNITLSMLSPCLLLIYVNDIQVISLFVDNYTLQYSSTNLAEIEFGVNQDISRLTVFSQLWLTMMIAQRTEVIFFSGGIIFL